MERKSLRVSLFVLLVVVAVGTERADLVWSAPQRAPADVVGDRGETPNGIEREDPANVVEDKGEAPDGAKREDPEDVVDPAVGDVDVDVDVDDADDVAPDGPVVVDDDRLCANAIDAPGDVVEPAVDDAADGVDGVDNTVWGDPMDLRITEIMYHPPARPAAARRARSAFEYVELLNIGELPLKLSGFRLSSRNGVRFRFPSGMVLGAGKRAVAVKDLDAFTSAYALCEDAVVAGEYAGCLGDDGDFIVLADRLEKALIAFEYSDRWYPSTDGEGEALALFDERVPPRHYGKIGVWFDTGPNPGCEASMHDVGHSLQLPGDTNQDAFLDISDTVLLLGHLFGGTKAPLPCEGTSVNYGGNLLLLDVNGDYVVDLNDAIYLLNALFGRGYPPVRGVVCIAIEGCPFNAGCPEEGGE